MSFGCKKGKYFFREGGTFCTPQNMTKKLVLPLCEIFLYLLFYFLPRHKWEKGLLTRLLRRTAPQHSFLDGKTAIGENSFKSDAARTPRKGAMFPCAWGRASARAAARAVRMFL